MDDEVLELLTRSRPRPVSEDPSVSAATRKLVHSASRTARRRPRRSTRTGFVIGIAITAAACGAVLPVLTNPPSAQVDAIVTPEPESPGELRDGPNHGPDGGYETASPESMAECRLLSRIVPNLATADGQLAENLKAAREFLVENDLDSLPLVLEPTNGSGPDVEAEAQEQAGAQWLTSAESALAEAGLLRQGVGVETTVACTNAGAP